MRHIILVVFFLWTLCAAAAPVPMLASLGNKLSSAGRKLSSAKKAVVSKFSSKGPGVANAIDVTPNALTVVDNVPPVAKVKTNRLKDLKKTFNDARQKVVNKFNKLRGEKKAIKYSEHLDAPELRINEFADDMSKANQNNIQKLQQEVLNLKSRSLLEQNRNPKLMKELVKKQGVLDQLEILQKSIDDVKTKPLNSKMNQGINMRQSKNPIGRAINSVMKRVSPNRRSKVEIANALKNADGEGALKAQNAYIGNNINKFIEDPKLAKAMKKYINDGAVNPTPAEFNKINTRLADALTEDWNREFLNTRSSLDEATVVAPQSRSRIVTSIGETAPNPIVSDNFMDGLGDFFDLPS